MKNPDFGKATGGGGINLFPSLFRVKMSHENKFTIPLVWFGFINMVYENAK